MSRATLLFVVFALVLSTVFASNAQAAWWVETQVARDDVRVTVDRSGSALVEHRIQLRVSGGPLYEFEVNGVDHDAEIEPDAYVVLEQDARRNSLDSALPVVPELRRREREAGGPEPFLHLELNGKDGISRGAYVLVLRYTTDLFASGRVERGGALTTLRWTGAVWEDGLDATRATFLLPVAPTEPRAAEPPADRATNAIAPTFLSSLVRTPEHDELELLRPYAARGEPVTWAVEVDARALDVRVDPDAPPVVPEEPRGTGLPELVVLGETRQPVLLGAAAALLLMLSLVVAAKSLGVKRAARAQGAVARPVVPLPMLVRAPLAALAVVAGLALQLVLGSGTLGSLAIAIAALLVAHRSPRWSRRPLRGPGKWLPVSAREAFGEEPPKGAAWFDIDSWRGRAVFALLTAGLGALVYRTSLVSSYQATLLALDEVVLIALFFTGRGAELPPDPAIGPGRFLARVGGTVTSRLGDRVRVVPRIRLPHGQPDADELRLWLLPRRPVHGLKGIEVGAVHAPAAGGTITFPELLVRYVVGTSAAKVAEAMVRGGRPARGRTSDERVLSFTPRMPTAQTTAELAAALVVKMTDEETAVAPTTSSPESSDKPSVRRAA